MAWLKRIWLFLLLCLLSQCAPSLQAEAMIFVADFSGSEIYMADFSSDSLFSLTFSPLPLISALRPYAIDYDPDTRMVYWTELSGKIRRGRIDGTGEREIASGLGKPEGIALDTSRGKVFWTDETLDRIVSANLDGSSQQVLINTDIYHPRAIIVHSEEGVMFWTDRNYNPSSRIERANLDGGDRYVIVSSGLVYPNGLAFSADGSRIYWCDSGTDNIESVGLWGEDRMIHLATSSIYPVDLAIVDDSIVWADKSGAIGITSNDNSSSYGLYYHIFNNACGLHVYQEEVPTPTEVYYPTEQPSNEPTQERELICDSTSMTLLLDRGLLEIGDAARDVHFEDESCVGYDHDSQRVAITTMYDRCDTKQGQEEDNMVFSNVVTYYKPRPENGTSGIITREHYLHIPVTCYLKRERILGESFTPGVDKYIYDEEGYGEFSLSLDRYTNAGFYQHANDSGMVELGTPLYFGVTLNSVTNLTLLIESCWATSSPYPFDDHRYDIIEDGCAVDSTTTIYYTSSPTFERFRVDAFTFIGDYDKVYVHCSILICDYRDTGSRCAQGCLSRARRSLQSTGSRSKPHTITNGPLSDASHYKHTMMVDNDNDGGETYDPLMNAALSALCVLVALIVFMSLVVIRMRHRHGPEMIGYRRVGVTEDY